VLVHALQARTPWETPARWASQTSSIVVVYGLPVEAAGSPDVSEPWPIHGRRRDHLLHLPTVTQFLRRRLWKPAQAWLPLFLRLCLKLLQNAPPLRGCDMNAVYFVSPWKATSRP
jgi:hypothetical protein